MTLTKVPTKTLKLKSLDTGIDLWSGGFGNDYNARNQLLGRKRGDWRDRIPLWMRVLDRTGVGSILEVGCNAGWNGRAIRRIYPDIRYVGTDINTEACEQAAQAGIAVVNMLNFTVHVPGKFELVVTSGVLIHIEPEHLREMMQALADKSYLYVLAVEYEAETEEQIEYRGHADKCWKRPYGALYEALGLRTVDKFEAGIGFDRCTAWLMEK